MSRGDMEKLLFIVTGFMWGEYCPDVFLADYWDRRGEERRDTIIRQASYNSPALSHGKSGINEFLACNH